MSFGVFSSLVPIEDETKVNVDLAKLRTVVCIRGL
jgi:hypothetical protein